MVRGAPKVSPVMNLKEESLHRWAVGGWEVMQGMHYKGFRILTYISAPDGKAWLVSNEIDVD